MKKIFVADGDCALLDVMYYILTSHGFEVYIHHAGRDFTNAIKYFHPDLVILDFWPFRKSIDRICKELKTITNIPIILFSTEMDKEKALSMCDADDFIGKPFNINQLVETISSHLIEER
jgi:two-component system response regulator MtrA